MLSLNGAEGGSTLAHRKASSLERKSTLVLLRRIAFQQHKRKQPNTMLPFDILLIELIHQHLHMANLENLQQLCKQDVHQ